MAENIDNKDFLISHLSSNQQAAANIRSQVSQDDFRYLLHLIKVYHKQQQADPDGLGQQSKPNSRQVFDEVLQAFNAYMTDLGKPALSVANIRGLFANRKKSYAAARKVMQVTGLSLDPNTMMLDASEEDYRRAAQYPELTPEDIQLAKQAHIYYPFHEELDILDGTFANPKPFSPTESRTNIASLISNAPSYGDPDNPASPQVNPELAALDASNYSRRLDPSSRDYQSNSPGNEYPDESQLPPLDDLHHHHHHHHQQHHHQQQHGHHTQQQLLSDPSSLPLSSNSKPQSSQTRRHAQRRPPVSQNDFINLLIMIRNYQMTNPNINAPSYKKRMFDYIHDTFNEFLELHAKQTLTVSAIKNLIANRKRSYTAAKKVMNSIGVHFNNNTMRLDATEEDYNRALQMPEISSEDVQLARQVLIYFPLYDEIDLLDNTNSRAIGEAAVVTNNVAERINEFLLEQQQQQQDQDDHISNEYSSNIYDSQSPMAEMKQDSSQPSHTTQHIPPLSTANQMNMVRKMTNRPLQRRPPVSPEDFCHLLTLVREYETHHPDHNASGYKKRMFDQIHDQFNEHLAASGKTTMTVSAIRNLIANRKRSYTAAKKVMRALNVKFNLATMKLDATEQDFERATEFPDISAEDVQMSKNVLVYFPLYQALDAEDSVYNGSMVEDDAPAGLNGRDVMHDDANPLGTTIDTQEYAMPPEQAHKHKRMLEQSLHDPQLGQQLGHQLHADPAYAQDADNEINGVQHHDPQHALAQLDEGMAAQRRRRRR